MQTFGFLRSVRSVPPMAGAHLVTLSSLDLLISAATFSSLGVVLPHMVSDLGWNWSQAGFGFTILGAACGGSSLLPTLVIRKLGVRTALMLGGVLMAIGLYLMGSVNGLIQYFTAAAICGVAYQTLGAIPATFVVSRHFKNKSTALGLYFTLGGFGNVLGPWMVLSILSVDGNTWRDYWQYQSILLLAGGLIAGIIIGLDHRFARPARHELTEAEPQPGATCADAEVLGESDPEVVADSVPEEAIARTRVHVTKVDWTVKEAVRTPQFFVIVAAYFAQLMALVTVTSLSVGHLVERGVSNEIAGAMLSLEAFIAVLARVGGGFLGERIDPRNLMIGSLAALSIGCLVLASTDSHSILLLYAIGTGIGFGMTGLSCTVLLMNYFGQRHNLELFSLMCMVGAASALGPTIGGIIRDVTGNFVLMFLILSGIIAVVWVAVVLMHAPHKEGSSEEAEASPREVPGKPDASIQVKNVRETIA